MKKIIWHSFLYTLCALGVVAISTQRAHAQVGTIYPFGGRITYSSPCNSGAGFVTSYFVVAGPKPGSFIVTEILATAAINPVIYNYKSVLTVPSLTAHVLGTAIITVPPIPCTLGTTIVGAGWPVIKVGTSMPFPIGTN